MARRQRTSISGKDSFAIEGADGIAAAMGDIAREVRKTIAMDALELAALPIFADVKAASSFSDRSGKLRASIEMKRRKSSIVIRAGSRDAFYATWIEFGHDAPKKKTIKPRSQKALFIAPGVVRASAKPGPASPRPFIRPAFDKNADKALRIMAEEMDRGIQRVMKRTLAT